MGPENTPELSYLPLEDADLDTPYIPPPIIIDQGGAGAMDPAWTLLPALMLLLRRTRRKLVTG
jgi:hypothetical protein